MQQYVVTKSFSIGEIGKTLQTAQTILFDGAKIVIGEETYTAPTITTAIRKGWIVPSSEEVPVESHNKPVTEIKPLTKSNYKVVEHGSSDESIPAKQPRPLLDLSLPVISDAEEDVKIEDALPSIKMKKKAREALKAGAPDETIPNLEVKSDGGEMTTLNRQPKSVRKNVLDTMPIVDTRVSVPTVEPRQVFGGLEFNDQDPNTLRSDTVEVLSTPKVSVMEPPLPVVEQEDLPGIEALAKNQPTSRPSKKKASKVTSEDEHKALASSVGAEPLARPVAAGIPADWKSLSFRDRKNFVEDTNDVNTLKALLVVEKGAVKKFITSKLEGLS